MAFFARYKSIESYNLIPFKSIIKIFETGSFYSIIINIFGNFLVFVPLEYFMIKLFNIKKFSINLITSFIIIFLVELLQYIFKVGVLDIDDLILCTLGMNLFYAIYKKLKKENKWKRRK